MYWNQAPQEGYKFSQQTKLPASSCTAPKDLSKYKPCCEAGRKNIAAGTAENHSRNSQND
jgi:hypothetical protein